MSNKNFKQADLFPVAIEPVVPVVTNLAVLNQRIDKKNG